MLEIDCWKLISGNLLQKSDWCQLSQSWASHETAMKQSWNSQRTHLRSSWTCLHGCSCQRQRCTHRCGGPTPESQILPKAWKAFMSRPDHNLFMIAHDLFVTGSWLAHDLLMICSWIDRDLVMTCSWLALTCSWLAHDLSPSLTDLLTATELTVCNCFESL